MFWGYYVFCEGIIGCRGGSCLFYRNSGTKIEDMEYHYERDGLGRLLRNRLYHINDAVGAGVDATDIDDMGTFSATTINGSNNYVYDEEGRLIHDEQEEIEEIVWRVDGKVKEIVRSVGSTEKNLIFDYNAMGNRIAKHIFSNSTGLLEHSTYYLLDASGNTMSTYEHEVSAETALYYLAERHIFGSSRLGMLKDSVNMDTVFVANTFYTEGSKLYEMSNHLGNVLSVISDYLTPLDEDLDGEADGWQVGLVSVADYSPFGVQLDGRTESGTDYRYGFQNQEMDDEIKGEGNSVNYKYRMHDPRVGRFFAVDPLAPKYPHNSPYAFSENVVINAIELEGLEKFVNIKSLNFREDITQIKTAPDILYQGKTSWCGAIAAVYLAVVLDNRSFMQNTRDLYWNGYVDGPPFTLDLDASEELFTMSPSEIESSSGITNTATFIAASTFKNNYNPATPFGGNLDKGDLTSQPIGVTYPRDIVDYLTTFHDISYKEGDGKYDLLGSGIDYLSWNPIAGIQELIDGGYTPLLIVDDNAYNGGDGSLTSQHYLVLKTLEYDKTNKTYKATFFNPNGGQTEAHYTKEEWSKIINWYGGFKTETSDD